MARARILFTRARGKQARNEIELLAALRLRIHAKDKIPSKTLANNIEVVRYNRGHKLSIPYYWAIYVHDGRGPVTMPPGKFMVYFRNIEDDPRIRGGYAKTRADRQHLSPGEFQYFMEINRQARALGQPPVMIVKRTVGRVSPNRFFTKGLAGVAVPSISQVAQDEFSRYVTSTLRLAGIQFVKDTATALLR